MLLITDSIAREKWLTKVPKHFQLKKRDNTVQNISNNNYFFGEKSNNNLFIIQFCRVGIRLPTVEVRFKNLTVEADSFVGSRALPTLPNVALTIVESLLGLCGISTTKRTQLTILKNASGIVKP
jgi:hypothetical protein